MSETRPPIGQPDIIRLSDEDASRKVLESAVCGLRELLNGLTQSRRTGGALGAADAEMNGPLYPSLYQINTRIRPTDLSRDLRRPATLDDIPDADVHPPGKATGPWIVSWPLPGKAPAETACW
jgi:hypothetical protein